MSPDNKVIILVLLSVSISFSFFLSLIGSFKSALFTWDNVGWVVEKFGSAIGAAVPIGWYFIQQWRENRQRMRRSIDAILNEIDDHEKAFSNPDYPHVKEGDRIDFTYALLNTDVYESLVYTGLLTYFHPITQDKLSNLYIRIKIRNETIMYRLHYDDTFKLYDEAEQGTKRYREQVTHIEEDYERDIKKSLMTIKTLIIKGAP